MGMFDSVRGRCPHCRKEVMLQSKAGECLLDTYDIESVPVEIAKDLNKTLKDYNTSCEHCGGKFTLIAKTLPQNTACELVILDEELRDKIEDEKEHY